MYRLPLLCLMFLCLLLGYAKAGELENALQAYQEGRFDAALEVLIPLAEADNIEAQDLLSDMYFYGEGVPADPKKSFDWSSSSAALGSSEGQNAVAVSYEIGDVVPVDKKRALELWQTAAASGNAKAQFSLSLRYLDGKDVAKDEAKSMDYLRASAANGRAKAMVTLAQFHLGGLFGLKADEKLAVAWMGKAAEARYPPAQYLMASYYALGTNGVSKDYTKALMWLRLASPRGCVRAAQYITVIEKMLDTATATRAKELAKEWDKSRPPYDRREHDDVKFAAICSPDSSSNPL